MGRGSGRIDVTLRYRVIMNTLEASTQAAMSAADRVPQIDGDMPVSQPLSDVRFHNITAAIRRMGFGWSRHIEFSDRDGHVTLRGHVRSYAQKQLAQHLVMQVTGVQSLVNQLVVG